VSYPVVIGNSSVTGYVESSTAFGFTAAGGTGSKNIYGESPVTYFDPNSIAAYNYYDYWDGYYGGYAFGSGGAGSGGDGGYPSGGPGTGGGATQSDYLVSIGAVAPVNYAHGGPGYGEQIVYSSRYYYYGPNPYYGATATNLGAGGNASGNSIANPGVLYMYYDATKDDPKSITGTYTKYEGNGYKLFIISTSGSVTF
jgi:hypothetical protein